MIHFYFFDFKNPKREFFRGFFNFIIMNYFFLLMCKFLIRLEVEKN